MTPPDRQDRKAPVAIETTYTAARDQLKALERAQSDTARRLLELMKAVLCDPFSGMGKPELLKVLGAGIWSRRITQEHRYIYLVKTDHLEFLQGRYHF